MSSSSTRIGLLLALLASTGGCGEEEASGPPPLEPETVAIDTARRTTSPAIALRNLDASIDGARAHYELTGVSSSRSRLIGLLSVRASMTGAYDDFQALDALTNEALATGTSDAYLERSSYLSTVHRFAEADALLDEAAARGADASVVEDARVVIDLAVGAVDPADVRRRAEEAVALARNYGTLSMLAGALAAEGRFREADQAYRDALDEYTDVSPFVFAHNAFQRGVMWAESADRPDLAEPLYREAIRRNPAYVVANVHLAELESIAGDLETARGRLRVLVNAGAGDPEPYGFLGELEAPDADALIAEATARYDVLLGRHREAFADHGSEFFSGPGADPARGLELAAFNLERRQNPRAYVVALGAADAAGDVAQRCAWAREAEPLGARNPVLAGEVEAALEGCD